MNKAFYKSEDIQRGFYHLIEICQLFLYCFFSELLGDKALPN